MSLLENSKTPRAAQERWDAKHPEIVKAAQAKYNESNPVWSFRPSPELRSWLEEERWEDSEGQLETNAALVLRKLEKLRQLERQGY